MLKQTSPSMPKYMPTLTLTSATNSGLVRWMGGADAGARGDGGGWERTTRWSRSKVQNWGLSSLVVPIIHLITMNSNPSVPRLIQHFNIQHLRCPPHLEPGPAWLKWRTNMYTHAHTWWSLPSSSLSVSQFRVKMLNGYLHVYPSNSPAPSKSISNFKADYSRDTRLRCTL